LTEVKACGREAEHPLLAATRRRGGPGREKSIRGSPATKRILALCVAALRGRSGTRHGSEDRDDLLQRLREATL